MSLDVEVTAFHVSLTERSPAIAIKLAPATVTADGKSVAAGRTTSAGEEALVFAAVSIAVTVYVTLVVARVIERHGVEETTTPLQRATA
jgi:hypothetical protein